MMEHRPLIERLARHLAATPDDWPARVEDAASILAILKQPDSAMITAGDAATWEKMIDAALRERWTVTPPAADADPPAGADEEGEIRLSADAVGDNRADWVHLQKTQERSA
jgi:hypothetical protein